MAIFHATTKPISRSSGRSSTASAAYRAGCEIEDKRTGIKHDYSKRSGVVFAVAFDKDLQTIDRSKLWNLAESAEKRKDGRTAREWILAIPNELVPSDPSEQSDVNQNHGAMAAIKFAQTLAEKYNIAVDVAIHSPDKQGDNRNHHAHIMTTTRQFSRTDDGMNLGDKSTIELSNTKRKTLGLGTSSEDIKELREVWANIANDALEKQGINERIDHRSNKERGLDIKPTIKMGWKASSLERDGIETRQGDINRAIKSDNEQIKILDNELYLDNGRLLAQKRIEEMRAEREDERRKVEQERKEEKTTVAEPLESIEKNPLLDKYQQWKAEQKQTTQHTNETKSEPVKEIAEPPPTPSRGFRP